MAKKRANRKPAGTQEEDRLERYAKEMRIKAMQRRPGPHQIAAEQFALQAAKKARDARLQAQQADQRMKVSSMPKPPPPAGRDPLAGRTVEAGTRSIREGLRSWMRDLRGGGGSRLTGR